jgi:hypothetical protein
LIDFPKRIRRFLNTHPRKVFVDHEVDARYLATIHPLEGDQIAAFTSDGDAHRETGLYGIGSCLLCAYSRSHLRVSILMFSAP